MPLLLLLLLMVVLLPRGLIVKTISSPAHPHHIHSSPHPSPTTRKTRGDLSLQARGERVATVTHPTTTIITTTIT
jgi:hypothetical protein